MRERLAMKTRTPQTFPPGHSRSQETPCRGLERLTGRLPPAPCQPIGRKGSKRVPLSHRCRGQSEGLEGRASAQIRAGSPGAGRPGGLRVTQLCGDSRPGLGSGLSESQEPWSGRALRAPLQPQSGLKSIFHSTAPKSSCAPTPFWPPWARWRGGGYRKRRPEDRTLQSFTSWATQGQAPRRRPGNALGRNCY